MPKINIRFAIRLGIAFALIVGVLFGVYAIQSRRIPDALRRQAERADAAGKTDVSIRYLRQYLEFRPLDVAVRVELAEKLAARGAHPSELFHAYDQVLRVDANQHETRKAAVKVCMRLGRYTDAAEHAEKYLANFPTDSDVWLDFAQANTMLARTDATVAAYEGAIKATPQSAAVYLRYISFLIGEANRPDDAKAIVDRLTAALPDRPEPYLARARLALTKPEAPVTAAVLADVNRTLALAPNHADALLLKADCLQRTQDVAGARDCLNAGMKAHPKDARFARRLAWVEVHRGNPAAAVTILEEGLKTANLGGDDLLIPLGDLLVQLGETDRAETIAKRLETRRNTLGNLQAKYLRARMLIRAQDWAAATSTLQTIRTEGVSTPGLEAQANLLLAMCYRAVGDTDKERESLKLILDRDPRHNSARVTLAQSYLNTGQFTDAGREYEDAARSPFASGATIAMALRIRAMKYRTTGRPEDWLALDRVALSLQNRLGANSTEPVQLRADLARIRGQRETAWALLRQDVVKHPNDANLWAELIQAAADVAGSAAAFHTLDEALALAGDCAELRAARATLAANDPARLRPVESATINLDTWPEGEREHYWQGLIDAYDSLGDSSNLCKCYARLAGMKNDPNLWFLTYESALLAKNEAIQAMAMKALLSLGQPAEATVYLCELLNPATPAPARINLGLKVGPAPTTPDACRVLALVKASMGETGAATNLYERAVKLDPTGLTPMKELLAHYARIQDEEKIRTTINRLHQDPRWTNAPLKRVVVSAVRTLEPANAERLIRQAATVASVNAGDQIWLGDCYTAANQPAKATSHFLQALQTSKNPDHWLRLGLIANATEMVNLLDRAATTLSPTAYTAFLAALQAKNPQLARVQNTPDEQFALVQAKVSLALTCNQRTSAIQVIDTYLNTPNLRSMDQAWAKRALGLILADGGQAEDRRRAYGILLSPEAAGQTASDQRTTAAVITGLARYLDGTERTTALVYAARLLENVIAAEKSPRDQFLLYQVLRANGDQPSQTRAVSLIQELQTTHKNTEYTLANLEECFSKANLSENTHAAQLAATLKVTPNGEARVTMTLAIYDIRCGRVKEGLAILDDYRRKETSPSDAHARASRVLDTLENLLRKVPFLPQDKRSIVDYAVSAYESMVHVRAEAIPAVATLLAMDGRTTDAFAFVDKHGQSLPVRLRAAAGVAIVRGGVVTPAQESKVALWVDAAVKEEPNSIAVKLTKAEWLAHRDDPAAAEQVYLNILQQEPTNPHALNNLAWLLAPKPERAAQALDYIERAAREIGYTPELLDTRARIRIAARQAELAADDATLALTREKTPLRYFHLAMAKQSMSPPRGAEAKAAYQSAKASGLAPHMVHPADLPLLRSFDAGN